MEVWFGMEDGLNVGYWFRLLTLSVIDNENLYYYAVFLPSYIFPKHFGEIVSLNLCESTDNVLKRS